MSYDIRFGVKVENTDLIAVIGQPEYHSPTYNIGTMLRVCMDWDFQQSYWYKVNDIISAIEHGIHELRFNTKKYKQYEPDNGWGTVESAINALESIIKWLSDDYYRGWNGDIPLDYIYMTW